MLGQAFLSPGLAALLVCAFAPAPFPREENAVSLGVEFTPGGSSLQVSGIFIASPALEAGLTVADTIVALDGQRIATPADLVKVLRRKKPGAHVSLVYRRDGVETMVRVKLAPPVPVHLGVGFGDDLVVLSIASKSPAEPAGLRVNDLILTIDKAKLTTPEELMEVFKKKRSGDLVEMTVRRNNSEVTVQVRLGKRPGY